jgi:uncharacterized membrane protein YbhN (UPF0104 family)
LWTLSQNRAARSSSGRAGERVLLVPRHGLPARRTEGATLLLLAAALAVAAAAGVAWAAGFAAAAHELRHLSPAWLALALAAEAIAYLGYSLAYREIVRAENGAVLRRGQAAALVSVGFAPFVPAGGFHVDLHALRRSGLDHTEARTRVFGLGALEYVALAPAACACAILLIVQHARVGAGVTYPWAIAVPAGFAAGAATVALRRRLHGLLREIAEALEVVRCLLGRPRRGLPALAGTALYWAGDATALWACLRVFDTRGLSLPALLLGYATGYALTRRTLPLGGAGVVEALLPFALVWVSPLDLAPALLGVLAYRLVNLWLPLLPAAVAFAHVRRLPG